MEDLGTSPFGRLALTHALLTAGDALLTLALAGSLFFSISPTAAKPRVALYLALTMAPLALVAPLLGPTLDQARGGRRLVVIGSGAGRALLCLFMATDLNSLLLFPEAFGVLVLSKAHSVAKSALVPALVTDEAKLIEANSKLTVSGVAMGLVAALPGVLVLQLAGGAWVLRLASVVFACGTIASLRIPPVAANGVLPPEAKAELRAAAVVLAASAMALLRGTVGFLTFLVAFTLRREDAPSWWFGVVLASSMIGTLIGNLVAPRVRERVAEENILIVTLVGVAAAGLLAARGQSRMWAAVLAAVLGVAASAGKLAFDSLVQQDAPDGARGRSFARFETRFQLAWVIGAFLPVVLPIPARLGYLVIAIASAFAAFSYYGGLRTVGHFQTPSLDEG